MMVYLPTAVNLVADFIVLEGKGRAPAQAQEIQAVILGKRLGGAQAGPIAGIFPVNLEPGTSAVVPLCARAYGRAIAHGAVQVSEQGSCLLGTGRAIVQGDHC